MVPSNITQSKDSSEIEANVSSRDVSSGIVQEVANGIQDPPLGTDHGDWLVVTRSRKSNQNRGKGKAPFKENKSSGDQGTVFKKVNDQNTKVSEKSSGTSQIKKDMIFNSNAISADKSFQVKKDMIFNSSAIASTQSRNKRHRVETTSKSNLEAPLTSLETYKHSSSGKGTSKEGLKNKEINKEGFTPFHPSHNIKTAMDVEILASNRLRFIDKDKLPGEYPDPLL
ncbi:hypothetical protein SESBI_01098 [Sesbania bispinosa]|nr:hypothetical protein SESBI_01098 [Sesbania bispinosa]